MQSILICLIVIIIPQYSFSQSYNSFPFTCLDRISYTFQEAVRKLEPLGFRGPFADDVTKYAVLRQVIEDGTTRDLNYSIVGMIPAGVNKEVVEYLKQSNHTKEFRRLKVSSVKDAKGQKCYVFRGQDASVWSTVAIVLVWDRYVNHPNGFIRKPELKHAWNTTKKLSQVKNPDHQKKVKLSLKEQEKEFKKCLKAVNRIYGPKHQLIEKSADKLD